MLSLAGRAVYLELLFAQFLEPDCSLPDDDRRLAALAGVTPAEWAAVRDEVLEWLPLNEKGLRQNSRMAHEWRAGLAHREAQRESGRRGGQASAKARSTEPQPSLNRRSSKPQASDSVPTPTPFKASEAEERSAAPLPTSPAGSVAAQQEPEADGQRDRSASIGWEAREAAAREAHERRAASLCSDCRKAPRAPGRALCAGCATPATSPATSQPTTTAPLNGHAGRTRSARKPQDESDRPDGHAELGRLSIQRGAS